MPCIKSYSRKRVVLPQRSPIRNRRTPIVRAKIARSPGPSPTTQVSTGPGQSTKRLEPFLLRGSGLVGFRAAG